MTPTPTFRLTPIHEHNREIRKHAPLVAQWHPARWEGDNEKPHYSLWMVPRRLVEVLPPGHPDAHLLVIESEVGILRIEIMLDCARTRYVCEEWTLGMIEAAATTARTTGEIVAEAIISRFLHILAGASDDTLRLAYMTNLASAKVMTRELVQQSGGTTQRQIRRHLEENAIEGVASLAAEAIVALVDEGALKADDDHDLRGKPFTNFYELAS